ncbi:phosphoserine phosphatase SerB [Caldilinea sp.]|uniref:phosphoserine phosphatase SerB n=1 Tax=Caldilinea sp. TaxID=2293560 RepID=UPI002B9392CC|nr:phosphoserine phosphatase SerB [Caldilinea sp.]
MSEIILVNVTGKDRTGLVARVTGVLAEHGVNVLDIGQGVIHDYISLGLLVEIPDANHASPVLKDLLFAGHELGVEVRFRPTTLADYETWVAEQGKQRHIITLLGRKLSAAQISSVAAVCAAHQLNIDVITRLSGRPSLSHPSRIPRACVQMTASGRLADEAAMRARLLQISTEMGVDISFHVDDIYRRNRRLVVFDMDSTLIEAEVIDELAKEAGAGAEVAALTAAAMRGELDFRQSLTRRVALLAGLPEETLATVAARIRLTDGAELVTSTLKRLGYKIGILSGGFDYFGKRLQEQLGFDYMYANRLEIVDGRLTGRVLGAIIDGPRKAALLREIAAAEGLRLEQTIAVGDGANDLPMLSVAGLGVAFHAKPLVRRQASGAISDMGLDGLLYLIGIRERELEGKTDE